MKKLIVGMYLVRIFLGLLSFNAIADENAVLMPKGMWKDPSSGLIWSRCSIGLSWDGNKCIGKAQSFSEPRHSQATTLLTAKQFSLGGFSDWRLPSVAELLTLRTCRNGMNASVEAIPFGNEKTIRTFEKCSGDNAKNRPSINIDVFPDYDLDNEAYWAASSTGGGGKWWHVYFGYASGFTDRDFCCYRGYVRPVRSSESSEESITSLFSKQLETQTAQVLKEKRLQEARVARETEQRRIENEEYEKRQQAETRAFNSILNNKDPQVMYLSAGKFERNGDAYKAKQIYESIVDRFPSSSWAVKANDQLLQSQRVDSVNSAARNTTNAANERAYKTCRIEVDSCYSRNGSNCYRDCDSLR